MHVIVHSKPECPYCSTAKEFLASHTIGFKEISYPELEDRQRLYDELRLVGRERAMPQVILVEDDGTEQRIGGCDNLLISGIESLNIPGISADKLPHAVVMDTMVRHTAEKANPLFTLLPVDEFALATIDFWIEQALTKLPADHSKIARARLRRAEIAAWQEMYGTKTPD